MDTPRWPDETPVAHRRRRARRARHGDHARALRDRVGGRRAPARRGSPPPGDRSSARGRWSSCAPGASRRRSPAGGVDVEWRPWPGQRPWPTAARGRTIPLGMPTRARGRCDHPDRAGLRAAGPPRARAARHLRRLGRTRLVDSARRSWASTSRATTPACSLRDVAPAHGAVRHRGPLRRRRRRRAQRGPGGPRHRRCPGLTGSTMRLTALFRAPLWQLAGAPPYGLYVHHPPRGGRRVPPRRPGRPLDLRDALALRPRASRREYTRARMTHARSGRAGVRRSSRSSRGPATFTFAAQIADRFRARPRPARRRRRPPGHAARRHRPEHGAPGRVRSRLEARLDPGRPRAGRTARHLRGRATEPRAPALAGASPDSSASASPNTSVWRSASPRRGRGEQRHVVERRESTPRFNAWRWRRRSSSGFSASDSVPLRAGGGEKRYSARHRVVTVPGRFVGATPRTPVAQPAADCDGVLERGLCEHFGPAPRAWRRATGRCRPASRRLRRCPRCPRRVPERRLGQVVVSPSAPVGMPAAIALPILTRSGSSPQAACLRRVRPRSCGSRR